MSQSFASDFSEFKGQAEAEATAIGAFTTPVGDDSVRQDCTEMNALAQNLMSALIRDATDRALSDYLEI